MTAPFTREELYHHVWNKPVNKLVEELGLTYWDIKQWCKKLEVPLPPQGHWSRIQFGKAVEQIPLPPLSAEAEKVLAAEPDFSESRQVVEPPILFNGETELSFAVPDRLINPDKLIVAAEKSLRARTTTDSDYGTVRTNQGELSIRVTPANINRALRIMDVLVKCWRRRGYRIEFKDWKTKIHLRQVTQVVRLWEVTKELPKENPNDPQRHEPTGNLAFKMQYWLGREWRDGKQPLEDQILDILNHMEVAARQLERSWAESAEKKAKREEPKTTPHSSESIPEAPPKIKQKKALKKLIKQAKRWKALKTLDEYLAEMYLTREHASEFLEWLNWAKAQRNEATDEP